jgi:chromate reductase
MPEFKVGYFFGSLAKASINRLLARALVRLAPAELELTEIPFKDLPLYSHEVPARSARPSRSSTCAACSATAIPPR